MRRTVPSVGRNPKKLPNEAKCLNEVGLILNGVGISMVIVCFSRGVGSLPFTQAKHGSSDDLSQRGHVPRLSVRLCA